MANNRGQNSTHKREVRSPRKKETRKQPSIRVPEPNGRMGLWRPAKMIIQRHVLHTCTHSHTHTQNREDGRFVSLDGLDSSRRVSRFYNGNKQWNIARMRKRKFIPYFLNSSPRSFPTSLSLSLALSLFSPLTLPSSLNYDTLFFSGIFSSFCIFLRFCFGFSRVSTTYLQCACFLAREI